MSNPPVQFKQSASVAEVDMINAPSKVAGARPAMGARRSLFNEYWWCDASSAGAWSSIDVTLSSTRKVEFIYALERKYGFTELTMPYLSRVMDIVDVNGTEDSPLSLSDKVDVAREIIGRLPRHDACFYTLAPESDFELSERLRQGHLGLRIRILNANPDRIRPSNETR